MIDAMSRRRGAVSLAQLMIAVGIAAGVTLLVAKLGDNTSQVQKRSLGNSGTLEARARIAILNKEISRWWSKDLQPADQLLASSVLTNCLKTSGAVCPPDAKSSIQDDAVIAEAGTRAVVPVNLYVRVKSNAGAPVAADFEKISGTVAAPVYLDNSGATCAAGAADKRCVREVTSYFIRQNATGNPGAVYFIVRMRQNPATLAPNAPPTIPTTYDKINVGLLWTGTKSTGPIPVGGILPMPATGVPNGFVACNGALLTVADHPALYAAIGTNFNTGGESAGVTFRVPDFRGIYERGLDSHTGTVDPDAATRSVGSVQAAQVGAHSHPSGGLTVTLTSAHFNGADPNPTVTANASVVSRSANVGMPGEAGGASVNSGGGLSLGGKTQIMSFGGGQITGPAVIPVTSSSMPGLKLTSLGTTIYSSVAASAEVRPAGYAVQFMIRDDYP